jgi:AcrR family transcriptional regulator
MGQGGGLPPIGTGTANSISAGLDHPRVSEIQRVRLLAAMADVACERGAGDVSVAHVVDRAGVSRRTFYEIFDGQEECFLATFEEAIARASEYVSGAYAPAAKWSEEVRGALGALLRFLRDEPALGRVAVVESLSAGSRALELRRCVIARMVTAVDAGRDGANVGSQVTVLTAEGVVGGVASVIHGRLVAGDSDMLDLLNPLMAMIVLPYLGAAAARRELDRPVANAPFRGAATPTNQLKGLDMRLTYRTMRVLAAVKEHPRRSNRVIGEASGIGDQGQASKLLARLERLGLVENARTGAPKGATNAWTLTEQGEGVANVLAARITA